jgi:hypothetical protein
MAAAAKTDAVQDRNVQARQANAFRPSRFET